MNGKKHTESPSTSGTSVIGIKYKDGVILAADMLGSYGSIAKFYDIERIHKINSSTVIGFSGDIADFQYLHDVIKEKIHDDHLHADGFELTPPGLHSFINRVMYSRRTRLDPLWNTYIVAGFSDGAPFLGYADMKGVSYEDGAVATGYGKFLATPKLRDVVKDRGDDLSEEDARQAITEALKVLYYRDCRASLKYQLAVVNGDGVRVTGPHYLRCDWTVAHSVSGYE